MPSSLLHHGELPDGGFSPFRRHRTARALSTYVLAELRRGRFLHDVLEDEAVTAPTAGHPELFEDLASDQEVLAAIADRGRAGALCAAPAGDDAVADTRQLVAC